MQVSQRMLREARLLINQMKRCSTTMFMRRMRLSFREAGYLMDAMEELGWISGPVKGGGAREILQPGLGGVPRF